MPSQVFDGWMDEIEGDISSVALHCLEKCTHWRFAVMSVH